MSARAGASGMIMLGEQARLKVTGSTDDSIGMQSGDDSPFAGVPIDARVEGLALEVLTATGDGETVSLFVPPLLRTHALSAHVDLEAAFARWPAAERWRVEFFGEAALESALAVGVMAYLRDLACAGVSVMMLGIPVDAIDELSEQYTGLELIEAGMVVDEDEPSCSVIWAAA